MIPNSNWTTADTIKTNLVNGSSESCLETFSIIISFCLSMSEKSICKVLSTNQTKNCSFYAHFLELARQWSLRSILKGPTLPNGDRRSPKRSAIPKETFGLRLGGVKDP